VTRKFLRRWLTPNRIALACAGLLTACQGDGFQKGQIVGGATKQMRDVEPVGGFLPDPSLLEVGGQGASALMYRNSSVNLSRYDALILDPVTIWTGPNSPVATVPEEQRQVLANTFTSDLYQTLKTKCRMTQKSGPGVARLRFALVDVTTPNATLDTIANYTPYLNVAYKLASAGLNQGVAYLAGTATIEGYATDSVNGAILWQAVDKRGGKTALLTNTLNTSTDADNAFKAWSSRMLVGLQQLGICNS
jgi:Protein of unknown function (DUF3313)